MATSILVTGGTGTLGRPVAQRLRDAGASVTVLSRHPRQTVEGIRYTAGDLSTGEGVEAAVRGAEVIVHCAGSIKGDEQKTRTLVSAAKDARHIVLISVVGADRIPQVSAIDRAFFGYFGMKLATERVVEQSGAGWTTLRATQFHELILMVARALARLPVIPVPTGSRFQPVDVTEVAERMAELALGKPSGLVPDLAGPKIYTAAELVKSYLSAVGKRRPLVPVHIPGQAARAVRAGANLAPDRAVGKRTWEEFLSAAPAPAGRLARPRASPGQAQDRATGDPAANPRGRAGMPRPCGRPAVNAPPGTAKPQKAPAGHRCARPGPAARRRSGRCQRDRRPAVLAAAHPGRPAIAARRRARRRLAIEPGRPHRPRPARKQDNVPQVAVVVGQLDRARRHDGSPLFP
jgi:uncharacterized protein YbjT (DUF2867 family)